jgi:hypothetical protein
MNINTGNSIPHIGEKKKQNQAGQTLVEFVLLLLMVVLISFSFIRVANTNLSKYWSAYVRLIVDDPAENSKITL